MAALVALGCGIYYVWQSKVRNVNQTIAKYEQEVAEEETIGGASSAELTQVLRGGGVAQVAHRTNKSVLCHGLCLKN